MIRKDKTDRLVRSGRSRSHTAGTATPVPCALPAWLDGASISPGPIFRGVAKGGRTIRQGRLDPGSVARIVKRVAVRAGLPDADDFSGHCLRSGLATEAARLGATDKAIMDQ